MNPKARRSTGVNYSNRRGWAPRGGRPPRLAGRQARGGATRDKTRMSPTPKANKPGTGGPHPWSGNKHDVEPLVKMVENSRKMVGPDGVVMFDAHCAVPPPLLIQFAAAIEPYDVMWIE